MKSTTSVFPSVWSGMVFLYLILLVSPARTQGEDNYSDEEEAVGRSLGPVDDPFARSAGARYIGNGGHVKGGWRPVMTSGSIPFAGDGGHKVFSGPGFLENKAFNVHGFGMSAHGSTSSRPLITRDVNKVSNIAQTYKPSMYPQAGVNLNAPINSYLNPFAFTSNAAINPYKPVFHFDNNVYLKQATSHRPLYTKQPQQQLLLGMRIKPNQYQILQQHPNNQFHQQPHFAGQQMNIKKPIESYSRPSDNFNQFHHPKPNEHKPAVNPQESLNKQTQQIRQHQQQGISAVTYKPAIASHFPQFGLNEDSFAPIPSSILGSFSSFGHASVKARDPPHSKNQYQTLEPTKNPDLSTVTKDYVSSSTINTEVKVTPKDSKSTSTINQNYHPRPNNDFKDGLVPPPPQANKINNGNPSTERTNVHKDNFIPSPVDPLNKAQNQLNLHIEQKFPPPHGKHQDKPGIYSSTKRPLISSFFDSNIISPSTIGPFEAHSTHGPNNLLVQPPPPHSPFGGQESKIKIHKDKHHTYSHISHSPVTTNYNVFDDVNQFSHNEIKNHPTPPHSYEVTESWEPFGEDGTQSPINNWDNPPQTFKQYTSVLGPSHSLNKIVPTFYPPLISSHHPDINTYNDISTIYSIVSENSQQEHSYENSLTSPGSQSSEDSEQSNKQVVISPSPNYINVNTDRPRITTTDAYQETTTNYNSRRKPSRYRPNQETTTEYYKELTTRFETYKENVQESNNDVVASDLATLPPNKHYKRPSLTTTTPSPVEDSDKYNKRNKNRRRRPQKTTASDDTTEESIYEKNHKYRTTTMLPENEETTKFPRNRLRFPQKIRPTRPISQPELTSSAQPTTIPTNPITLRPKLHSRIRTTQGSLDFDEMIETTTIKDKNTKVHEKQSSIMKIAKDNYFYKPSANKYSSSFGATHDTPDYSHKQDEKDTPTSDISMYLPEKKYSSQKENNLSFSDLFLDLDSDVQQSGQESLLTPTATPQPSDQIEPQASQLSLSNGKSVNSVTGESSKNNEGNTNANDGDNIKKSKLYGNRPRFSVKDYKNRLNQYSTTTTEKPLQSTDSSPRLRFPNRTRFPAFKDSHDSKTSASEVENATEQPKKKFVPKDAKHKMNDEKSEKGSLPPTQKTNSTDNEFVSKANNKFRGSLRRDPNKVPVGTTVIPEVTDKSKQSANIKRPNLIRKRVQATNATKVETVAETLTEAPITTTTEKTVLIEETVENVTSTEKSTSETAIMKIAKDDRKHSSTESSLGLDLSQRVSDLTLASSKDYNTPGMFKSVSPNMRRVVPNYFTIATDDPILPIEAFFPQLNQKKDS